MFAGHGFSTHVFQFSVDLPGYGGFLRAVHTGDMPIIFRNLTEDVLQHFPGFDGLDRGRLRDIALNNRERAFAVDNGAPDPSSRSA